MEGIPTPVEAGILSHWQIYKVLLHPRWWWPDSFHQEYEHISDFRAPNVETPSTRRSQPQYSPWPWRHCWPLLRMSWHEGSQRVWQNGHETGGAQMMCPGNLTWKLQSCIMLHLFFVWIILWNKNMSLKCLWSIHQKISRVVNRMWVWVKTGLKGFCNGNLNCWKIRRVAGHWWLSSIHGNKNRSPLDWQCFFLKHGFSGQLC